MTIIVQVTVPGVKKVRCLVPAFDGLDLA